MSITHLWWRGHFTIQTALLRIPKVAVQNSETVESPHQNTTLSPRYRKLIEEHDFSKNSCGALELIVLAISEMMYSKTQRFSWFEFEKCILIDFLMSLKLSAKTIMGLEKGNKERN
ncbi:hypothetical protein HZH68_014980 [Vespula germanica]|uniref:Uncharacterized protein n=1 Tax=Vespula germanica TaxID=30212 RepID=A0A834JCP5_VESGE|nr:hypothetical protein HZH68_014980 [Vespula germanica]